MSGTLKFMVLNSGGRSSPFLVYFSSASENTRRFIEAVGLPAARIPLRRKDDPLSVRRPYILLTPTYGGGDEGKAVPRQVIRFLNDPDNRRWIRGVITSGNINFGEAYCAAGRIISAKCRVPELYRFELLGTRRDVETVREGVTEFWRSGTADTDVPDRDRPHRETPHRGSPEEDRPDRTAVHDHSTEDRETA
jgi:protein involved in ribonucleotide reduction